MKTNIQLSLSNDEKELLIESIDLRLSAIYCKIKDAVAAGRNRLEALFRLEYAKLLDIKYSILD